MKRVLYAGALTLGFVLPLAPATAGTVSTKDQGIAQTHAPSLIPVGYYYNNDGNSGSYRRAYNGPRRHYYGRARPFPERSTRGHVGRDGYWHER